MIQVPLFVLTILAVAYSQAPNAKARKWSPIFGIAAQPFWFISTINASQWGIAALTVIYTAIYLYGFKVQWLTPARKPGGENG